MKTNTSLCAMLVACAMTACGGGSDSATATNGTTGSTTGGTTGGTTAPVTTNLAVYSSSGSSDPSTATSTSNAGATSIAVGSQTATVSASDASGNATAISGSFTKVIAFGGNAVGQFCANSNGGTNGFKALYSFVLANAEAATLNDAKGKTFNAYADCALRQTATINSDGSASFSLEGTAPASEIAAAFSSAGNPFTDNGTSGVTKAKAFKVSINGSVRIAIVVVDRDNLADLSVGSTEILIQQ